MRVTKLISALSLAGLGALLTASAFADYGSGFGRGGGHDGGRNRDTYTVQLRGMEEVPVVISSGSGELRIVLNEAAGTIDYQLGYQDLEGTATQAHIHIGQANVAGGVSIWLCQTATNAAPASVAAITPFCPAGNSGNVSGTVTSANVVGP